MSTSQFTSVLVKNRLAEIGPWLKGFQGHRAARMEAGLHETSVLQNIRDPQEIYVSLKTTNPTASLAFLESPELGSYKKSLGVIAPPVYSYLTPIDLGMSSPLSRVRSAFACVDLMDAAAFSEHFASSAAFQFGNLPAVHGPQAVKDFVAGFFANLRSIGHEPQGEWEHAHTASVTGIVHYGISGGRTISVPFSNRFEIDASGKFTLWQIFADVAPLFQALASAG